MTKPAEASPPTLNATDADAPVVGQTYKVGPGHPPLENQFKKGQSGNPQGRPRKSTMQRMYHLMAEAFEQEVVMRTKTGPQNVSALKALCMKTVADSLAEGGKGISRAFAVIEKLEKYAPVETRKENSLEQNHEILAEFLERSGLSAEAAIAALQHQATITEALEGAADEEAEAGSRGEE